MVATAGGTISGQRVRTVAGVSDESCCETLRRATGKRCVTHDTFLEHGNGFFQTSQCLDC